MKPRNLAIAFALTLAAGGVAACSDELVENPKSFITTDNYFKTPADVESAALGMYGLFYDWNMYKVQQWWTFELAADQGKFHPDEPNEETRSPEYLNWTSTSRDAIQPWKMHYWNIQRANLVVDKAQAVTFSDATKQTALVAEGKFMRAYDYFWLARAYGGVPLYTSLDAQAKSDQGRATEAEVIDQVIKDASDAAEGLPATRSGLELGRATSGAALTLLADAYRWKANVISHAQADWTASAAAAKKVIDGGHYSLNNDYLAAFLPGSQNRPEEIFAAQAHAGGGWFQTSAYGTTFFPRNNPRIEGWAVVSPTPEFYNSYVPGDYRHDVTFWTKGCANGADASACPNTGGDTVIKWSPLTDARFPDGYPHVHKYRPSDGGVNLYGNDVNTQLYRYADVLLLYAEAEANLGNAAEALNYVNMIRARARKGASGAENRTSPADLSGLSGTALIDAIYQERSWELSYELGKRWFDLVQRGPQYFTAQLLANDPLSNFRNNVNEVHMRLPIPLEEIQKNPAITQNPGY
ncbi:MAG TPA: RagB/SusD family nutrient uptake outer membrane protein [Gemmatimonadaceae bacterium]|nr:RagB/SusD family nutrient uptake outer membrane protein [Gemmatimonadaceae bacterium]